MCHTGWNVYGRLEGGERRSSSQPHHVTVDLLRESFHVLKRNDAPAVDGVTWQYFEVELEDKRLHARVQSGVGTAYLAAVQLKPDAKQRAVMEVLNVSYEEDFIGCSYGFRPGRSQHDVLDAFTPTTLRGYG